MFENLWTQIELTAQLKEANERLNVHDRMQKEFINVAAHELRTPIQPVIALSQHLLSQDSYLDVKLTQQYLDIIVRNAIRLQRLTEDILDVTRIETQSFIILVRRYSV